MKNILCGNIESDISYFYNRVKIFVVSCALGLLIFIGSPFFIYDAEADPLPDADVT